MSATSPWLEAQLRQPPDPRPLESVAQVRFVEVDHGALRVLSVPGEGRPLVLIPGFGASVAGWQDFYALTQGRLPLHVVETLEKRSTRLNAPPVDLSPSQMARDIAAAVRALGLDGEDHVLMGSCWGATLTLVGALEGSLNPPTLVAYDPMHAMYFNKALLRWVAPHLPAPLIDWLRAPIRDFTLRRMTQPVQRARAVAFVDEADPWRWSRAAGAAWDLELFDLVGQLGREVLVFNGSHDAVHDSAFYPRLAGAMPRGRFFHMPVDEADRERLAAVIALELCRPEARAGLPDTLAAFERPRLDPSARPD